MNHQNWPNISKRSSIASESPFSQQNYGFTSMLDSSYESNNRFQYLQQMQATESPLNPQNTNNSTQSSVYSSVYNSRFPVYGLDWSNTSDSNFAKIAISSYREDITNRVKVIYGTPHEDETSDDLSVINYNFERVNEAVVSYPVTRLQWDPSMSLSYSNVDRFATTSECLRIYEVSDINKDPLIANNNITSRTYNASTPKLIERAALTNAKTKDFNQLPPVTSFDWNFAEPKNIISCSIDTTCTLWDLSRRQGVAKTQLIAHDSEVFDVKFVYGDKHVFASCSNDGSIRVFDLRYLEHSTIIYEPQLKPRLSITSLNSSDSNVSGLLRLATSNYNANHLAAIEQNSNKILILDLRMPGTPIKILQSHSGTVNSIQWHPTKNLLLSGGDDCQVLIHDLSDLDSSPTTPQSNGPDSMDSSSTSTTNDNPDLASFGYFEDGEVNNTCWSPDGDWVAVNSGRKVQAVKLDLD